MFSYFCALIIGGKHQLVSQQWDGFEKRTVSVPKPEKVWAVLKCNSTVGEASSHIPPNPHNGYSSPGQVKCIKTTSNCLRICCSLSQSVVCPMGNCLNVLQLKKIHWVEAFGNFDWNFIICSQLLFANLILKKMKVCIPAKEPLPLRRTVASDRMGVDRSAEARWLCGGQSTPPKASWKQSMRKTRNEWVGGDKN